jgi:protein-arginine kinase
MFKDSRRDRFLVSAGSASDWPYGRACYLSSDRNLIIWIGEEDHVRIMCMECGTRLDFVLRRLKELLDRLEPAGLEFAEDNGFGYLASCPSNIGTGMRASVHIDLPRLTRVGSMDRLKGICERLEVSVRGVGGEHTAPGKRGTVDISPRARMGVSEAEIVGRLWESVGKLVGLEQNEE